MSSITRYRPKATALVLLLATRIAAQTVTSAPAITAVSACHPHGATLYCEHGTEEYAVAGPTATEEFEAEYTDCHSHGADLYCVGSQGAEVEILGALAATTNAPAEATPVATGDAATEEEHEHSHCHTHADGTEHCGSEEEEAASAETGSGEVGANCHYHAGVPHCEDDEAVVSCERIDHHYNVPLRIGALFVILVTASIGVFAPILITSFTRMTQTSSVFLLLKQFGTGVILSTAFIHLYTHADLMFGNECLGRLQYEGITAAVFLAGLFLTFLVDFLCARFIAGRKGSAASTPDSEIQTRTSSPADIKAVSEGSPNNSSVNQVQPVAIPVHGHEGVDDKVSVSVLEAGIIFHSLLIGLTLVVAPDVNNNFRTLFIVIIFHQMFEGIALGSMIAGLRTHLVSFRQKMLMASAFAIITPVGMAIGLGVLQSFNGSDKSTIVAIGTLDAFSAGILAWVGIVEMLAKDWMDGPLLRTPIVKTSLAMLALVGGLVGMSVLGKWA